MTDLTSMTQETVEVPGRSAASINLMRAAALIAGVGALVFAGRQLGAYVPQFANWVGSLGVWGPIVFIAGYALATVAFIPGSILTLAAGAVFGLVQGTLFVFLGAWIGSALAFLVARYLARSAIERRLANNSRFSTIDQAVQKQGLKIVLLLRLSPIFPYNLLNYALGLTKIRFSDYLIASIGMIPGTFLYVYYGKALGSIAAVAGGAQIERGIGYWLVLALGLTATIVVTTIVTRIARKALSQEVNDG